MASAREKVLVTASVRLVSNNSTINAEEMSSSNGSSFETVSFLILIGRITAAIPMSRSTFIMLLPMTLPTRMSVLPLMRDEKETASSGAPVPKATIVRPTKSLLTLRCDATEEAPSTSQSAPLIKRANPTTNNNIWSTISITFMIISYLSSLWLLSEETLTLALKNES